jgi:hypothetical protein
MVSGYIEVKDIDVHNKREVKKQIDIRMDLLGRLLADKTRYLISKEVRQLRPKLKGISRTKSTKIKTEGLYLHETVTTIREYTLKDLRHYTQISKCNKSHYLKQRYDDCMAILCNLISIHRFSVLGTSDGYKVVTNGYGDFQRIETAGLMDKEKVVQAATIFTKLETILKEKKS